jgi:hypothetical protein
LAPIPQLSGRYRHPALGAVIISDGRTIDFLEPGLRGILEPIGPNLFGIRVPGGWLEEIGADRIGELLFSPQSLAGASSVTVYLGEDGEGTKFRLVRQGDAQ